MASNFNKHRITKEKRNISEFLQCLMTVKPKYYCEQLCGKVNIQSQWELFTIQIFIGTRSANSQGEPATKFPMFIFRTCEVTHGE